MSVHCSISRKAGNRLIVTQAQSQVQSFFDELKNGTLNYRTIASLDGQIAQEYRGRCILELLQNAHDALVDVEHDNPKQISFVLITSPEPVLLIGNSGHPFRIEDFKGICQLGQSPKDPNESVGNKGLGFRSVLEVSTCPEIWSTTPTGSDTSFVFRFDPSVSDQVATAAQTLEKQGLNVSSAFSPEILLVDWSSEQLNQYRKRLSATNLNIVYEAKKFLSPYLFPLTIEGVLPEVEKLLSAGYSTVIRLQLDGGRGGTSEEAVQSVKDQLQELDARSMLFLSHLETLVIDIDGERCILERVVDSDDELSGCQQTRQQRLLVESSEPTLEDDTTRQFQVWTRIIGGEENPDQAEHISTVVKHLPNRWPEVRRVTVGVAVEVAPKPEEGVFVIFLPTEMTTGTGAHINAPFYGSLDRRQIHFKDPYNKMLLESVLDLCLDAVTELISEGPEDWRAQTVIDLLSSTGNVGGKDWQFMDRLHDRALERDNSLESQALVLCDDGWHISGEARMMPDLDDNLIGADRWRKHAEFAVVSNALDERQDAVEELLTKLDGLPSPTHCEWRRTIERVAKNVQARKIDVTCNDFFNSLIAVLPDDLRSEQWGGRPDPLAATKFLPTQDGRLLSASDSAKLFFQPVRGVDDAADLVGEVPNSLKRRVAFLHPDIRMQEGPQRRNTAVQKFLDDRFARGFRREELLRDVVVPAVPPLPVPHGSPEASLCSELFAWTMKLLGNEELETSLDLIKQLPVACHGGWLEMSDTTFGPGWQDRLGDLVWSLANELPDDAAMRLRETALLPPDDPRWETFVEDRDELFIRMGVVDGLRLQSVPEVCFSMSEWSYELPTKAPVGILQTAWDDWRRVVRENVKPYYSTSFDYTLDGIQLLPEIYYLPKLSPAGRNVLSDLVLASLESWPAGWHSITITKCEGQAWSRPVTSPLSYWLKTQAWLSDGNTVKPLSHRWLVPVFLPQGQVNRFRHLDPLSPDLARKLEAEPDLKAALIRLGLNVYPTEDDQTTGPELLEALAAAWDAQKVPIQRFDVFLGQVREAWKHLDPDKGLPKTFLVKTGRRTFSTCGSDELTDVYLPDNRDRTRSLQEHGKRILEMDPRDATRKASALAFTNIRRALNLKERFLIDGVPWTREVDGIPSLEETEYATWLPVILLTVAAHGGTSPTGATTNTWLQVADRLRRTHVLECENIVTELVDKDQLVASIELTAQWLPGDVLAIQRDMELSYERLAPATQAMLDRQDLLKDLRLVLGALAGQEVPTPEQIEAAMELAEIDAQALEDIRQQWAGTTSLLVDRIRPVLELLEIPTSGFEMAAMNIENLTEWLSSNLQQWPASEILSAARRSCDDCTMGEATWRALGDVAELPVWNKALATLGDQYVAVKNNDVEEQRDAHLKEAAPLLRGLARHIAIEVDNPSLFHKIEALHQSFKSDKDWSTRWWEVPFKAVIDKLSTCYSEISGAEHYLEVIEGATTIADLRTAFQTKGMATHPDPYETADANKRKLEEVIRQVYDLHRAWVELRTPGLIAPEPPESPDEIDSVAYLHRWSEAELLEQALYIMDDSEFVSACNDCVSLNDIRERLKLDSKVINAQQQQRLQREQEIARKRLRKRRIINVAGDPFEVGMSSYSKLFERLNSLAIPEGPHASEDALTPLSATRLIRGNSGGGSAGRGKTSHLRPSAEHRDLVGIVGEIHAYRFLRAEFGNEVVTRDAWVSEIRLKVLPPVKGELDNTSDSHGFDFQFSHRRKNWYVEVKATAGDDPQFDLGISEINAATGLARRGRRWRILRVRYALSDQPEFDWLPNPFEKKYKEYFRLHKGGMVVSYRRK